ncbi:MULTISPECIES: septal junction protein FraD [unclassified Anabaena]|uniref:septal junction protein FraD n=1 Tax=unclassified Anabaena TaxID=2619674 RepID=UPI00082E8219|nr:MULTISPECIES: septal junction protein FraD [unclassified Anabaena]
MNSFIKDIFGIFKIFEDVYARIKKILIPPKAYSWQTLMYLSVFSWALSYFAIGYVRDIIALCGWLFLIAGTAWYTTDDPVKVPGTYMPLGAVITGFLVSVFALGNQETGITPIAIVFWPTIAALITAIPEFIEGNDIDSKARVPKPESRQKIIILVGSCMIISCWLQFYFVMDKWLQQYPSVLADDFRRSTFVIISEKSEEIPKNGVLILNRLQPLVEEQIADKRWSEVERWLLEANVRLAQLGKQVLEQNLAQYQEKEVWRIEPRVVNTKAGYRLDLLSIWLGPSSNANGYYLKKSCQIEPVAISTGNRRTSNRLPEDKPTVAEIDCDRLSQLIPGAPPPQQ